MYSVSLVLITALWFQQLPITAAYGTTAVDVLLTALLAFNAAALALYEQLGFRIVRTDTAFVHPGPA